MIERFYLKEFLSFKEAELEFNPGLIVFTGPSGSGKSILMRSILASVGLDSVEASICESSVKWQIDEEEYGIENDDINIFRHVKKEKTSYFINNQRTSKSSMEKISGGYCRHLSLKDYSDFEPLSLLKMVDEKIAIGMAEYTQTLQKHKEIFEIHKTLVEELRSIEAQESKLAELKEFAAFEIAKIDTIKPTLGEDEELSMIKKQLSKKEKIEEAIKSAEEILRFENQVTSALSLLDVESGFFDDAMNELRGVFEGAMDKLELLEEVSIEEVLNRIESLAELKRRYGGIAEALEYREQKSKELESYENIEYSKKDLLRKIQESQTLLIELSQKLSKERHETIPSLLEKLNTYLSMLYLRPATLSIMTTEHHGAGVDKIVLGLEGTSLDKLSSGEFNRLRLALLSLRVESMDDEGGVLMLDEIDANLSGEESMSVARVLRHLSSRYQIFVISHQPQLTSMGQQHFLIYKDDESRVRELNEGERVEEIARIISGDAISEEARGFARDLFERVKLEYRL
ncbi:MAG: ATPase [Sulfuricurvum sp.]|uniref:AAA family ATPase n=1 Tax=Sulfuricurvum sp. TaxID=2025608 RepID=UPI0026198251|nr:AAA family ATPase [Sulfuricurvum sp.]MDD2830495.1 ATPase [Sulfuricurvum sp.]MDD4949488.1 ATPase [Sulfuricurvum sp.]